jgi:hypothetical protein
VRDPVVLRKLAEHFHSLASRATHLHEGKRLSQLARECEQHAAEWDRQNAASTASSQITKK